MFQKGLLSAGLFVFYLVGGGGRCESRNVDGAVNPYLASALVLAAGLEGIREKLDPGEPNEDNLYEITDAEREAQRTSFTDGKVLAVK